MRRKIIPYEPYLKLLARNLRNNTTRSEVYLWRRLKGKQLKGYDFHRQKPLLRYIVDFYCNELELVIEVDGDIHELEHIKLRDEIRQLEIENKGLTVLRFTNYEVRHNIEEVILTIERWIEEKMNPKINAFKGM